MGGRYVTVMVSTLTFGSLTVRPEATDRKSIDMWLYLSALTVTSVVLEALRPTLPSHIEPLF